MSVWEKGKQEAFTFFDVRQKFTAGQSNPEMDLSLPTRQLSQEVLFWETF